MVPKKEATNMNIEIANRLVELRKKSGLSQEELADKLGLSRQAVSKWERAEASPDTDNLICLAKIYGVSLDDLLNTDQSVEEISKEVSEHQQENTSAGKSGIHINGEDGGEVHIGKEGIHIVDEDGEQVVIDNDGVHMNGETIKAHSGMSLAQKYVNAFGAVVAVVAYLLMGFLWKEPTGAMGWSVGWIVFFVPIIASSILSAIEDRRPDRVAYPLIVVGVYCGLGILGTSYGWELAPGSGLNWWHPFWVLFLTIPIYYIFCSLFKSRRGIEDDEKDD